MNNSKNKLNSKTSEKKKKKKTLSCHWTYDSALIWAAHEKKAN